MSSDLPFHAEYAKSSRASCKGCRNKIDKDTLRLAVMVQSSHFDGRQPNWYHFNCFFKKQRVSTVTDIADFDSLRWEDQQEIKQKMGGDGPSGSKPSAKSASNDQKDFSAEYAKSSRSTCRGCDNKIEKGVVRISKLDYESEDARKYGSLPRWYHIDCFVRARDELQYLAAADKLPGFFTLGVDDQKELKGKLKSLENKRKKKDPVDVKPAKKQKTDNKGEVELKKQNDLLYKYRDQLEKNLSKKEMIELLEFNNQDIPVGESKILDCLSDGMAFGSLKPCPECKDGQVVYSHNGYKCTGNLTEWTKCQYVTREPIRKPFIVPDDFKNEYSFLKKYKYTARSRLLPAREEAPSSNNQPGSSSGAKPLENMKVVIVGRLQTPKPEIVKKVEGLGGKVVVKIDDTVACVISNESEVKKMSKKIIEAKDANVHVVSEDFLDSVQNGGAVIMISQKSIASWGSDPESRIHVSHVSKMKSGKSASNNFAKSMPSKMKMKVKGGAAVDPESGMEDSAHVFDDHGDIYDAVLGMVDIQKGTNSFYKLQLLEADSGNCYWVYRSWGRVGTTIGGKKLDTCDTKMNAISLFRKIYVEKTGNAWEERSDFVKQPGRFYPLEIDYGQEDEMLNKKKLEPGLDSKLPKEVQQLICLIFDVENMKKALVEFEIDLNKMPLGKLSKRQIEKAYSVLTEAQDLIKNSEKNRNKLIDASNRFYTLIPHDFGMKKPPLLENEEIIKTKLEMLDSLLEIEVAYNLVKETGDSKSPVDHHYTQLKTDLQILDKKSEEFQHINTYVSNTHAATHNQYSIDVQEVFKVNRHGEEKQFKPFKQLHNKKLLWHGSRITNFAGILSQGLRIAPPEAPSTGYMFGKGVYFADMVSKSANYCYTGKNSPVGLIMLCEVALGNMYERTQAEFVQKLPPNMHSTKGVGRTEPNPSETIVTPDGVEIPLGKGVDATVKNSSLLYNEYIVYDTAQVNIKYLLKLNFNYKY